MPPGLVSFLRRAEIDRAVVYATATRVVSLVAAPLTLALIALRLSATAQGYYFTFASVIALQSFAELGFFNVVIAVASHEWAHLHLSPDGTVEGDPEARSRLVSLGRLIARWYTGVVVLFGVAVGIGGWLFFASKTAHGVDWRGPWVTLVALSAATLWTLPFVSLLEGCNQVREVNRSRLAQSILSSVALCTALVLHLGLWAVVVGSAANLARDLYLLAFRYRRFFRPFLTRPTGATIDWRTEVWPMQWRVGTSGLVNYFAFYLVNPVIFAYAGPVEAGRIGITLAAALGLGSVGQAWMQTKAAQFGVLIARRRWAELDELYRTARRASTIVVAAGAVATMAAVQLLYALHLHIAHRVASPQVTALLLLATLFGQLAVTQTVYLRAHKDEPILVLSIVTSTMNGLGVWLLGRAFGARGAALSYALVWGITAVWCHLVWVEYRRRVHVTEPAA